MWRTGSGDGPPPRPASIRPEGPGLTAALVDFSTPGGWDLSIDKSWFEETVWPALVERVPQADELKLVSTWSGHYDQNRLDGQMILDRSGVPAHHQRPPTPSPSPQTSSSSSR